jgi:hypothetical protein
MPAYFVAAGSFLFVDQQFVRESTWAGPVLILLTAAFSKFPLLTQLKSPIVVVTQLSQTQRDSAK